MLDPWVVLAAAIIEAAMGYPMALHQRIPHPVVWIGKIIAILEERWNAPERPSSDRQVLGIATLGIIVGLSGLVGLIIEDVAGETLSGSLIIAFVATLGLAQRSLFDHVIAVGRALATGDLAAARVAVGHIVGRDVSALDESDVAAAALESLAESFNDGVVAPLFWCVVGGLPGLFIYKAVNTADSMIGHREPRWKDFGWAAARTDDVLNFIPARLAGFVFVLAGQGGWRTMIADAGKHASPNAGWPEAAMAGALKLRFGGAASYDGVVHDRPLFNETGARPVPADLRRGLTLYCSACAILWALLALGGVLWRQ